MTTREQAMQWWTDFDWNTKEYLMKKYHNRKAFNETGREIEEIWRKETETENIYLNRLKEQYKEHKKAQKIFHGVEQIKYKIRYDAMRLFCLDTQLVSFNDIEVMEYEVNNEVNQSLNEVSS